jgi:hypothetical protein
LRWRHDFGSTIYLWAKRGVFLYSRRVFFEDEVMRVLVQYMSLGHVHFRIANVGEDTLAFEARVMECRLFEFMFSYSHFDGYLILILRLRVHFKHVLLQPAERGDNNSQS